MKNKLVVFTGPSGVGKATIEKELFKDKDLKLAFSISVTTRTPRAGEKNGREYYFVSMDEFNKMIDEDKFLEWNSHFSNKYGTLISEVERISSEGFTPFLEVEVNGAENIIKKYDKKNIVSIFIAPPSIEELRQRIKERGSENDEQIDERVARVSEEMAKIGLFDHIVVNDTVEEAVEKIKMILRGQNGSHN